MHHLRIREVKVGFKDLDHNKERKHFKGNQRLAPTQPLRLATSKPAEGDFQQWCVVLTCVNTAIFRPIQPEWIDVTDPTLNAIMVGTPVKKAQKMEESTM